MFNKYGLLLVTSISLSSQIAVAGGDGSEFDALAAELAESSTENNTSNSQVTSDTTNTSKLKEGSVVDNTQKTKLPHLPQVHQAAELHLTPLKMSSLLLIHQIYKMATVSEIHKYNGKFQKMATSGALSLVQLPQLLRLETSM